MIVRTITCHDVYNYGASLQAFALQEYLKMLGHDVKIINYQPDYLSKKYNPWYISPSSPRAFSYAKKSILFHVLYTIYRIPKFFYSWGRVKPFKEFNDKYLECTNIYKSYSELRENPPCADIYIAGSDQIWNSYLPNGRDAAFYLAFGSEKIKRISYAASIGINYVDKNSLPNIKLWLKSFSAISVRELSAVALLNNLGYYSIQVVDPVFLITANQWKSFFINQKKYDKYKNYILVYDLHCDYPDLADFAKYYASEYKCKIVSINNYRRCPYADINISRLGPFGFLSLIYNAKHVISNSFHATAFSILFHKPFSVFYHHNNISRLQDLLKQLDLLERLNPPKCNFDINWGKTDDILNSLILNSKDFIERESLSTNK